jgi:hypothetical protein
VRVVRGIGLWSLLALAACAAPVANTAPTPPALRGEHLGKRLEVRAQGQRDGDGGRFTVQLTNKGDQPIGFEVDTIAIQDDQGEPHLPLGKLQRFQGEAEAGPGTKAERVPWGPGSVEPGASQRLELEYERLPAGSLSLVVSALYRLGIDGQVPMNAVTVPLSAPAAAPAAENRFFDPFVDE